MTRRCPRKHYCPNCIGNRLHSRRRAEFAAQQELELWHDWKRWEQEDEIAQAFKLAEDEERMRLWHRDELDWSYAQPLFDPDPFRLD